MRALDMGIVIDLDAPGRCVQPETHRHAFQQLQLGAVLGHPPAQLFAGIGQRPLDDFAFLAALGLGDFHLVPGA